MAEKTNLDNWAGQARTNLDKWLYLVRRIEEHREEDAVKKLKRLYKGLIKDLRKSMGDVYADHADPETGALSYAELHRLGLDARLLEEVASRMNDVTQEEKRIITETVEQTYANCYSGMVQAVEKAVDNDELRGAFSTVEAVKPEVLRAAVNNPVHGLTLSDQLEKNRADIIYSIKQAVGVGLSQGDRYDTMARRIQQTLIGPDGAGGSYYKAVRIARTEAHRVREEGNLDAAQNLTEQLEPAGITMVKTWHTMKDERVRPNRARKTKGGWKYSKGGKYDHVSMEGVQVGINEEFKLPSGATTQAPGKSGVAGEDINCRCFLSYDVVKNTTVQPAPPEKSVRQDTDIEFDFRNEERYAQSKELIIQLSNEYNTRLQKVTSGAKNAAGDTDISGATMRLSSRNPSTAVHEFAHTLANTDADKYGLTNDQEFWGEIRKIRTDYRKAIRDDSRGIISTYADSDHDLNEFMAEAFTHAKMRQMGLDIPSKYGTDFTYSQRVLDTVDKYFGKPKREIIVDGLKEGKTGSVRATLGVFGRNIHFKSGDSTPEELAEEKRWIEYAKDFRKSFGGSTGSDARKSLLSVCESWIQTLSKGEKESISKYTFNLGDRHNDKFYYRLNKLLSKDKIEDYPDMKKHADNISRAINAFQLKQNIVCYRMVDEDPDPSLKVGSPYFPKQFLSSSISRESALKKPFEIVIYAPKGSACAYIENLSFYPTQQEVLFDKKCFYRVLSKSKRRMELEVILA